MSALRSCSSASSWLRASSSHWSRPGPALPVAGRVPRARHAARLGRAGRDRVRRRGARARVGIVGLALILYEGGLQTSWRRLREVAVPAALLSTVGVVVTALITGAVARALFDLSWLEAVLLGAVVASTDAAAVFSTLRFTHIRRRLARTLEAESGGNDPMAIALTLGLIAWIEHPKSNGFGEPAARRRAPARARAGRSASSSAPPRRTCSPGCRRRSGLSCPSPRSRPPRWRSGRPTRSAAAASSRSTSSGSRSAARRRATAASSSPSTKGSPSSRRSCSSSCSVCSSSPRASTRRAARAGARLLLAFVARPAAVWASTAFSALHASASGCCSAGPACAAPCRSCSPRSRSRPTCGTSETIFNAVFFVVRRLGDRAGDDARGARRGASGSSRSRRRCPRHRSRSGAQERARARRLRGRAATTRSRARPCASSGCRRTP